MAKIKKLTLDGTTIYPATIMEAVKNRATNKTLAAELLTLAKAVNSGATTPDAALSALTALGTGYNSVVAVATTLKDFLTNATDSDTVINKWKEIEAFLSGITETQNLTGLLQQNLNSAKSYTDTEIDKIEKSIGNDKTSESEDGTIWGELKSLSQDTTAHSGEISNLETRASHIEADVRDARRDIDIHSDSISTMEDDINSLQEEVFGPDGYVYKMRDDVRDIKANYVTTDTEQTIVGNKNFENGVSICGTQISEGNPDRQINLRIFGSFGANEFNVSQWSWLGDHFFLDGIDKEQIDLPEKSGTVALVEDIPGVVTQSANGLMSAADKKKLDAFGAATTYLTAAACNDVTDYPEITI